MKRALVGLVFSTLAAGALAGTAKKAQALPFSIGVRAGGVLAQDSELQQQNNTWLGVGVDVSLGMGLFPNSDSVLSLDYFGHEDDRIWIFNFNQRFYGAATPTGQRVYFLVGVGGAKFDIENGPDDTAFGGRAGVGMEFTPNFYAEASLFLSDQVTGGWRTNAIGLYLGWKL